MNDLTVRPADAGLADTPSRDLRGQLLGLMADTAERLLKIAQIVAELDRRGEDLSDLRMGDIARFRQIAAGQLLAELAVKYAGRPGLLRAMAGLPVAEQRRLAEAGTVDVLVGGQVKALPLTYLPFNAVSQVFAPDHLRPAAEQAEHLRLTQRRPRKAAKEGDSERHYTPRADRAAGGIRIGKMVCDPVELLAALAEYAGPKLVQLDRNAKGIETVTVIVTAEEKIKLRAAEKRRELPEWHIVREALQATGLI